MQAESAATPEPSDRQIWIVATEEAEQTIAALLRRWLPGLTWSQARQVVTQRRVWVAGSLCLDPARRLHLGERVEVARAGARTPPPTPVQLVIRHLDAHLVVVEKPAGMPTVRRYEEMGWPPARKALMPTLDEVLPEQLRQHWSPKSRPTGPKKKSKKSAAGVSEEIARRQHLARQGATIHLVHRLDRETSGLLVVARHTEAAAALIQQFRQHNITRSYLAFVHGAVAAQTIRTYLVRDRGDGYRGSTTLPDAGKLAVTHVEPVELLGPYQLIRCRLETGRTHQIRIHLSELGNRVCGDRKYTHAVFQPPQTDTSGAPRLALHAERLGFRHPISEEWLEYTMPLPDDLQRYYQQLQSANAPASESLDQ